MSPQLEDDDLEERAGPWKSGYGEYPFADEVYDLMNPHDDEYDVDDFYERD